MTEHFNRFLVHFYDSLKNRMSIFSSSQIWKIISVISTKIQQKVDTIQWQICCKQEETVFHKKKMLTQKSSDPVYTISTAARLLGISIPTLRMYENEGLIIPFKKSSSHRLYSDLDLERIKCLRSAINDNRMGIESIRRMLALIPCWAMIGCSERDRKKCEAFSSYEKPCWMHNHKNNICSDRECRECEVYNSFSDCSSLKEKFKELIPPIK